MTPTAAASIVKPADRIVPAAPVVPTAVVNPPAPVVTPQPAAPEPRKNPVPRHIKSKHHLTFTPKAWAKIVYMRDRGKSEVSGFGISHPDDPLHIIDFKLVLQVNKTAFTEFVDAALPVYLEDMCMMGVPPARCFRVWIHTHPGLGVSPSGHDEATFARTTEMSNWGIMCIVSDKDAFARLVTNIDGLSGDRALAVIVEFKAPFEGVVAEDYKAWDEEYCACVRVETDTMFASRPWDKWEAGRYGYGGDESLWRVDDEDQVTIDSFETDDYVNGEVVQRVEEADGYAYVFTERFWFQYGSIKEVKCDVGDTLKNLDSLSFHFPYEFGKCEWNGTDPIMLIGDEVDAEADADAAEKEEVKDGDDGDAGLGHTGS